MDVIGDAADCAYRSLPDLDLRTADDWWAYLGCLGHSIFRITACTEIWERCMNNTARRQDVFDPKGYGDGCRVRVGSEFRFFMIEY